MAHSEKDSWLCHRPLCRAVFVATECEIYCMRHTWGDTHSDSDLVSKCSLPGCVTDHPPAAFFITIRQLLHPSPSSDSDCAGAGVLLPESYFLLGAGPEPPEPSVTSYN